MNTRPTHERAKAFVQQPSGQKGQDFEDYIISLFNSRSFKLIEWRSFRRASNGAFPLSNIYPDLEFTYQGKRKHRFAIECKWRPETNDGMVQWAQKHQVRNYKEFHKETRIPVFIAIGLGGTASNPERLYITPLEKLGNRPEVPETNLLAFTKEPQSKFVFDPNQERLF